MLYTYIVPAGQPSIHPQKGLTDAVSPTHPATKPFRKVPPAFYVRVSCHRQRQIRCHIIFVFVFRSSFGRGLGAATIGPRQAQKKTTY
jgi:hypothetical protein